MKKSQFRASLLAASALSVSIASQLQAASITSAASGIWENPASWIGGVFPDTFTTQSAIIDLHNIIYDNFVNPANGGGVTTPTTPYTLPLGGISPGGLSVSNGQSITINGDGVNGSLTQANLPHEIRIGEGGGATGVGSMVLNGGGNFFSGSSVGVAVGSDLNNAGLGDGRVDINEGVFQMEVFAGAGFVPAGPAGLGVGIEGSKGVINVGDGSLLGQDATLDLETNGNNMGIGVTNQLNPGAGDGKVYVKLDGHLRYSTGDILVGDTATGIGLLQVDGGLMGAGNVSKGDVTIGRADGDGTFNVTSGTVNTASNLIVGTGAGSVGRVNITGGTVIFGNNVYDDGAVAPQKLGSTRVGRDGGQGTLTINTGGTFETGAVEETNSKGMFIGTGSTGSTGVVKIDGGTMTQHGWAEIGQGTGNTGTLEVINNGVYNHLENSRDMQVGYNGGHGIVKVASGGKLNTNWWINVARGAGSQGEVTIDGLNSEIRMADGQLHVGEDGVGMMEIRNQGTYKWAGGNTDSDVGRNGGSQGTLTIKTQGKFAGIIDGVNGDVGARTGTRLIVGNGLNSEGTVNVEANSTLEVRHLTVGQDGKGTVTQNGGVVQVAQWLKIGEGNSGGPTGDDELAPDLVTPAPGENRASYVMNNGVLNTPELMVGEARRGQMTVNGGTVNILNGGFGIGRWGPGWNGNANHHGEGVLTQNGGVITAPVGANLDIPVGVTAGAIGTLNLKSGAYFDMSSNETLGDVGARNGGRVILGNDTNSIGTLNIEAGAIMDVRHLTVGNNGKGTMLQEGGTVNVAQWTKIGEGDSGGAGGDAAGANRALYTLNGGTLNTPELMVGEGRRGEMVVNGGQVNIQNGGFGIGRWGPGWNGNGNFHGEGKLTQTGGIITSTSGGDLDLNVGVTAGAKGTLNVGGTAQFKMLVDPTVTDPGARRGGRLYIGQDDNSQGFLNIEADALIEVLSFTPGNNGAATVTQNGGTVNVGQWTEVGQGNVADHAGNVASYTLNGGTLNTQQLIVGTRRKGTMTITGGTVNLGTDGTIAVANWGGFDIGRDGGGADHGNGHLIMTGGTINATTASGATDKNFTIATNANTQGLVDFSGGTINANTGEIGREGGVGVLNVSGTATLNYNQQLTIGSGTNGNGTVNQTGGAVNVNSNWFALAAGGGSSGKYITSAGTLTVLAGLEVGADGVGLLDISGTAVVTANNVAVGVRDAGVGTIKITGGRLHSNDRIALGGDQSGGKGTLDLLGGVVETRYIYAQDEAVLNLGPGTLRATGTETNFLRDFNGVGLHSAINLVGTGPTIDTAGFDVRITTSSVFSDTDGSTVNGLAGTVLKKTGAGTLTIETAVDGNGTVSVQALAGITDFEASQTLDTLDIAGGAIVTLSTLASPPAPALADATILGGSPADWHGGVISSPDNLADLGGAELAAGPAVQGVPEPGMLGLLLVSGLGLLGRRNRKGKA